MMHGGVDVEEDVLALRAQIQEVNILLSPKMLSPADRDAAELFMKELIGNVQSMMDLKDALDLQRDFDALHLQEFEDANMARQLSGLPSLQRVPSRSAEALTKISKSYGQQPTNHLKSDCPVTDQIHRKLTSCDTCDSLHPGETCSNLVRCEFY